MSFEPTRSRPSHLSGDSRSLPEDATPSLLGVVNARLYGRAAALQQRLALVDDVAAAGDARFGPEPIVRRALQVLRDHYSAQLCVFVLQQARRKPRLFRIEPNSDALECPPEEAAPILPPLLALSPGHAMVYNAGHGGACRRDSDLCRIYDQAAEWLASRSERDTAAAIATALACGSFISVPLSRQLRVGGRLFVSTHQRRFGSRDIALLRPVIEQVTLMLENTCLLEMLAAEAADHERQRIARDLHDSAIQPYIGLKFGLEALARKAADNPALVRDIEHLIARTAGEITDMRELIDCLSGKDGSERDSLSAALARQTSRYSELFGIVVEISTEGEQRVSRSLAREILYMVAEGLSNICRHTRAKRARITVRKDGSAIALAIANDFGAATPPAPFHPRSLSERAAALGGRVSIDVCVAESQTIVTVSIPLED